MQQAEAVVAPPAKWIAAGAAAVLIGLFVRSAWVTEDAYITLRTVDNLVHGHGLGWNVGERVQGYTHPLWMFALSVPYFLTREEFYTTIGLSLVTSGAAVLLLLTLARSGVSALIALVLLCLSRSFIDYSTSGLENPLSHLLLACFVLAYLRERRLRTLTLIAALLALNRNDAVLLLLPALLHASIVSLRSKGLKHSAREALVGMVPLLAWELFALFYYGFPFPNTAYAKLNTGLPKSELISQGFTYLINTFAWDTPGMIALALGVFVAFSSMRLREVLLGVGVIVYLVYVVRVGGDFMLGRFVSLPLFAAACSIACERARFQQPAVATALLAPFAILFFQSNAVERFPAGDIAHAGIADERAFFRDTSSLLMSTRLSRLPSHGWADEGRALRGGPQRFVVAGNVGFRGLFAGPEVFIVDWHALTDALLARLPIRHDPNWRVGHYRREIPRGYLETLQAGTCFMEDANLCAYYAKLRDVIAGDLWSLRRILTVIELNLGRYDHLIDHERYRYPLLVREPIARVAAPIEENARWDIAEARPFPADGIELALPGLSHAPSIVLMLDGNDDYVMEFRRGTEVSASVQLKGTGRGGMRTHFVTTPQPAREEGYDRLLLRPVRGDGLYSVGHVRLQ